MLENDKQDKYFYDFGDTEPSDELPPAMEELSKRIAEKKKIILQQRENHRKAQQVRQCISKDNENGK